MGMERYRLANMLMETLDGIEQESGIFLIKPMYSYRGRYVTWGYFALLNENVYSWNHYNVVQSKIWIVRKDQESGIFLNKKCYCTAKGISLAASFYKLMCNQWKHITILFINPCLLWRGISFEAAMHSWLSCVLCYGWGMLPESKIHFLMLKWGPKIFELQFFVFWKHGDPYKSE